MSMENKISGIKSKFILREFLKIIPEKIYNRTFKVGFSAPEKNGLNIIENL